MLSTAHYYLFLHNSAAGRSRGYRRTAARAHVAITTCPRARSTVFTARSASNTVGPSESTRMVHVPPAAFDRGPIVPSIFVGRYVGPRNKRERYGDQPAGSVSVNDNVTVCALGIRAVAAVAFRASAYALVESRISRSNLYGERCLPRGSPLRCPRVLVISTI